MIPVKAIDLILRFEGWRPDPYWPGGQSGVTIGYGYDLAHQTERELYDDWIEPGRVTGGQAAYGALRRSIGQYAQTARMMADDARAAGARVSRPHSRAVFEERSLPKYEQMTDAAFPGIASAPALVRGTLVSLVFNRGGDMGEEGKPSWDRRREMREIRDAVAAGDWSSIPGLIESMRRLWKGQGLAGLLERRDAEAALAAEGAA